MPPPLGSSAGDRRRSTRAGHEFESLRTPCPAAGGRAERARLSARRGAPKGRRPSFGRTILALVGAMVMLVVGASLARAFGIVGAAGLIRYRAKIRPGIASVCSRRPIGLAASVVSAGGVRGVFVLALWVIESIDPEPYSLFGGGDRERLADLKGAIEGVLQRRRIPFELRGTSADETSYEVKLPLEARIDRVSRLLMALGPAGSINVKWEPKKDTKPS